MNIHEQTVYRNPQLLLGNYQTYARSSFGYNANASKIWLVIKPGLLPEAEALFSDTNVRITDEGRPHLGAPLGSPA